MYNKRVQFALDNFIDEDYFLDMNNVYHLREDKETGNSILEVRVSNDNLCIYDFDNKKKCNFLRFDSRLGMQKSVDHMLFENCHDGWNLHMIEMKSSVGNSTWYNIKQKVRTSYLTACAIAEFLGIEFKESFAYTTYENDKFEKVADTADPKIFMPELGKPAYDFNSDEWNKDRIILNIGERVIFPHKKLQMTRNNSTGILEGSLCI